MQFTVKKLSNFEIEDELEKIGFDPCYIAEAMKKHRFLTFKIQNIPPHFATIIKQTALSKGADAGVNRLVLKCEIENSDLILSGSIKQLEEIAKSLLAQPFKLKNLAMEILKQIKPVQKKVPLIMGILNITSDSFSDGGKFLNPDNAIAHAKKMVQDGAKIIDIGAEATNPKSTPVCVETEIERLVEIFPEIKKLNAEISIDTRNSKTAKKMLELGADIINDVSGFDYDPYMQELISSSNCKVCIMHSIGTPQTMDFLAEYKNPTDEIYNSLLKKVEKANAMGIDNDRIIIDVGFGFAKNIEQNFMLLKRIKEFNSIGVKQLAGVSRKRFLQSVSKDYIDEITMVSSFYLAENEVDIVRVHDVLKTRLAFDFYSNIYLQKSFPEIQP